MGKCTWLTAWLLIESKGLVTKQNVYRQLEGKQLQCMLRVVFQTMSYDSQENYENI